MRLSRHQILTKINQIEQEKNTDKKYSKKEAKALLAIAYLTKLNTKKLMNLKREQFIVEKGKLIIMTWGTNIKIDEKDPLTQHIITFIQTKMPERYIFHYFRRKTTINVKGKTYTRYNKTYEYWIRKWFLSMDRYVTPKCLM